MDATQKIISSGVAIHLGVFMVVLLVMLFYEIHAPRRLLQLPKGRRWLNNFAVMLLNTVLLRLLFPAAALGAALFADSRAWGVFNQLHTPLWLSTAVCVLALDIVIYFQHRVFHAVPVLWRVHRMHHADLDFDVSTGVRFHPFEIILSMTIKFLAVFALGAPVLAIVVFETVLSAMALVTHANINIPSESDRLIRFLFVTPDMHRVHHSTQDDEMNSNFGFSVTWWDRLFRSYRTAPRNAHETMELGVTRLRDTKQCQNLAGMLAIPFVR